jgi:hypothetical protein
MELIVVHVEAIGEDFDCHDDMQDEVFLLDMAKRWGIVVFHIVISTSSQLQKETFGNFYYKWTSTLNKAFKYAIAFKKCYCIKSKI